MKKYVTIILIVIFGLIGFRFIYTLITTNIIKKAKSKYVKPEVTIQTIKTESLNLVYETPARINSKYQVNVTARISGYLEKSFFKEGDEIKAGETLFLIEPEQYLNESNTAKAGVENIKAQLEYANKQLERAKELLKQDYIAKSKYDEIESNRDALIAQLNSANSNYKDTIRNLEYTTIKSPVNGRISYINVTVGNYVTPSSGALTTIYSTNPIYITFALTSQDYAELITIDKANQNRKVEFYFQNGEKYDYDGIQDFVDNKVDESTGTVAMRATFKNPNNQLLHGELGKIRIYSNNKKELPIVPMEAVQENQEGKYVYKINKNNIPELVYIKTNGEYKNKWIVSSGIKKGDKVITDGIIKVVPGKPVKIITETL